MNTKMTTVQVLNLSFHGIGRPLGRDFGEEERDYWASRGTFEAVLDAVAGRGDGQTQLRRRQLERRGRRSAGTAGARAQSQLLLGPRLARHARLHDQGGRPRVGPGRHDDRQPRVATSVWPELPPDRLEHEVNQGRQLLEELTGTNLTTLAIPYGRYDDAVLDMLRADAYTRIFTSDGGSADPDAWLQPREHVRSGHDRAAIAALLSRLGGVPPAS